MVATRADGFYKGKDPQGRELTYVIENGRPTLFWHNGDRLGADITSPVFDTANRFFDPPGSQIVDGTKLLLHGNVFTPLSVYSRGGHAGPAPTPQPAPPGQGPAAFRLENTTLHSTTDERSAPGPDPFSTETPPFFVAPGSQWSARVTVQNIGGTGDGIYIVAHRPDRAQPEYETVTTDIEPGETRSFILPFTAPASGSFLLNVTLRRIGQVTFSSFTFRVEVSQAKGRGNLLDRIVGLVEGLTAPIAFIVATVTATSKAIGSTPVGKQVEDAVRPVLLELPIAAIKTLAEKAPAIVNWLATLDDRAEKALAEYRSRAEDLRVLIRGR